ncbi:MAG: MBL fold metallo-hydrolase [Clostridia bacterium]|nr:MBL fold metallo-hydrolase [Clostridia bacterium]
MEKIINFKKPFMNVYLLPCGDDYCVLDTGYPNEYNAFIKAAEKNNIELSKIKYIVVTHVHADHVGFLQKLLTLTGATLICVFDDKERFASGANVEDIYNPNWFLNFTSKISVAFRKYTQCFEPVVYENRIDYSQQPLKEYGIELFLLHGHTSNDLCVRYKDIIFCGDICMNGILSTKHSPMWIEDNDKLIESWKYLITQDAKWLYPAHGKPFLLKDLENVIDYQQNRKLRKL